MNDVQTGGSQRKQTWSVLRPFVVAELFKLRHSRTARGAFAAVCITPLVLIGVLRSLRADVATFPQVLQVIGASSWVLVGLTTLLLTADWIGSEFEQGTARTVLGRGTPRWVFVVGKGVILLGMGAVNAFAAWLCGGIAALVSHMTLAGAAGLGDGVVALLTSGLAGVGVLVLEAAAYVGIGLFIGVFTRSPAFTTLGGLGLFVGDFLLGEFALIPGVEGGLGAWSILGNVGILLASLPVTMMSVWATSDRAGAEPKTAVFALVCYAIVGMMSACYLFRRRDFASR